MAVIELKDMSSTKPQLAVLIATDADDGVAETLQSYRPALDQLGQKYECVCVVDGRNVDHVASLERIAEEWPELTVLGQRPWGGEDAALAMAVRRTSAKLVLLLPGWPEVDPDDLPALFANLEPYDMISAVRSDRPQAGWLGARRRLFSKTLTRLFGKAPSDPFCRVRLIRREPLEDVCSFGVRQHFLPVIAAQRGYALTETPVRTAPSEIADKVSYVFKPLGHIRAMFDALTLYVVLTFLRRPLRFFGAIGLPIFLVGAMMTSVLVLQRLFGDTGLADRPALIFAVMMVVLGIQIIAIGLVGEIIIFAGSRRMKQYEVREVLQSRPGDAEPEDKPAQPLSGDAST